MRADVPLSERLRRAFEASYPQVQVAPTVAPAAMNAAAPRRRTPRASRTPDAVREARGIVIDLIGWEIYAADSDRMAAACEKYGRDAVVRALHAIANDLRRKGAAPR